MNEWMNEWMHACKNEWMNEWMSEWIRRTSTYLLSPYAIITIRCKENCVLFGNVFRFTRCRKNTVLFYVYGFTRCTKNCVVLETFYGSVQYSVLVECIGFVNVYRFIRSLGFDILCIRSFFTAKRMLYTTFFIHCMRLNSMVNFTRKPIYCSEQFFVSCNPGHQKKWVDELCLPLKLSRHSFPLLSGIINR